MRARWALVPFLFTLLARPAAAQTISELNGAAFGDQNAVVDQEVTNASRAVEEAAQGLATTAAKWAKTNAGGSTGAASAVWSLLVESDTVICAAWLISYERAMTKLAQEGVLNSDEGTALVGALQRLKRQIERICDPILSGIDPPHPNAGEGGGPPVRSDCPECDDELESYRRAKWAYDRAAFELQRAEAKRDMIDAAYQASPRAGEVYLVTPTEARAVVREKIAQKEQAESIMNTARRLWLECVEECHRQLRNQFGFVERNKKILIAGAVGVASTVAIVASGSNPPVAVASTPITPVTPVTTTPVSTPPVVTTPPVQTTPAPAPPSPAGNWHCAACQRTRDDDDHERVLQFCSQLNTFMIAVNGSTLRVTHPAPWVTLDGAFAEGSTSFNGSGTGSVGSFSNVSSRADVVFTNSGGAITSAQMTLTLGENGAFPGGRPVTYSIMLVR